MGALLLKVIERFSILLGTIFLGIFSGKLLYSIKGGEENVSDVELFVVVFFGFFVFFILFLLIHSELGYIKFGRDSDAEFYLMEIILTVISWITALFTVTYYLKNGKEINLLDLKSTPKSLFLLISCMILAMEQLEIKEEIKLNERLSILSYFIKNYDKNKLKTERQKIAYEELKKIDKGCKFSKKEINELEKLRALLEIEM
ncbi:hypothetical protein [Leptotrichia massiliensis]|uniref:hypothetical protein n=1 Tax=Leptotrichia massiliensis TaxID=1852388 RepID=UPI0028D73AA9|nr:hypothetical protein [Leptotrichia massiliensis]